VSIFAGLTALSISWSGVTAIDLKGVPVTLPIESKPTCLFFIGVHCPIANRLAPEMMRIVREFPEVSFCFVYAEKGVTRKEAAKHASEFGLRAQTVLDSRFAVARFAQATVTPEAALFDSRGKLFYHGRINDLYSEHNMPRTTPSKNDLRDAVRALRAGMPIGASYVAPVGCAIPY
jgi:hypothetical protein